MKVYKQDVYRGDISKRMPVHVAEPSKRYLNMYYWNARRGHWDKIVSVSEGGTWGVVQCNGYGRPVGPLRHHQLELDARGFADKPFKVRSMFEGGALQQQDKKEVACA